MSVLTAVVLGLVQGIAEFLPISSSGHLAIAEHLLSIQGASNVPDFFDVLLHLGTLAAVFLAFRGEIAPLTAAEIAKAQGIRVYTIGVGTEGMAPYPAIDMFGNITFVNQKVEIDEKTLTAISDMTGGKYFRATDKAKLKAIYDEINQLEKSKVEVTEHVSYHELYLAWVLAALGLLLAEFLLANLVLKRIP